MTKHKEKESSIPQIWTRADECPAKSYYKAVEDVRFLYKDWNEDYCSELYDAWKKINDEIIDEFGVDPHIQAQLHREKDLLLVTTRLLLDNDRTLETEIKIKQRSLQKLKDQTQQKQSPEKIAADLSVYFKMDIDLQKISIIRFMHYLTKAKNG
jgi:hypothetical protein